MASDTKEPEVCDPALPKLPLTPAAAKKVESLHCSTDHVSSEDPSLPSPDKGSPSSSSTDASGDDVEASASTKRDKPSKSKEGKAPSTPRGKKGPSFSDDGTPAKHSSGSSRDHKPSSLSGESSKNRHEKSSSGDKSSSSSSAKKSDESKPIRHSSSSSSSKSEQRHSSSHHREHSSSSSRVREGSNDGSSSASSHDRTPSNGHENRSRHSSSSSKKLLAALSGDEAELTGEVRERTASGGEMKHKRHNSSANRSQLSRSPHRSSTGEHKKPSDKDSLPSSSSSEQGSLASPDRTSSHSSSDQSSSHVHTQSGGTHTPSSLKNLSPVVKESAEASTKSEGDVDNDSVLSKNSESMEDMVEEAVIEGEDEKAKQAAAKTVQQIAATPKKKRFTGFLGRNASFVAGEISPVVYMRQRPMACLFIQKQGEMFKKSLKTGRWKKRYVVVTPTQLCCFKDITDSGDPEISIDLQYAVVRPRMTHDLKPAFDVVTTDGTLSLMGADNTITQDWFNHISQCIERLVEESAATHKGKGASTGDDEVHSAEGASEVLDKNKAALLELLQRPENHLCADCSRPDPQWASTNLGSFVCITCSGIHRGLGVHITKIRSVSMDTWTDEQVAVMASKGNKKVNDYYLATLPEGVKVPTPETPVEELKQFLHDKYVLQKYVPEGDKGKAAVYTNKVIAPLQISHAAISSDDVFRAKNNAPASGGRRSLTLEQHLMLMSAIRDDVVFRAELQRFIFQTDDGAVFKKSILEAINKDEEFKAKLKQALLE